MKCSKAQKLIGELLDETIGGEDKDRLEEHCRVCRDCREVREDFRRIADQAKGLAKFEPAEALWPRVLGGVRAGRRTKDEPLFGRLRPSYAFAAALALVAAVVGGVFLWRAGKSVPGAAPGSEAYTLAKLAEAESHYRQAIDALTQAVSSQKGAFDPEMAALFERDLKVVDGAILACRSAVAEDPKSVSARVYLLGAYRNKVEFLDAMIDVQKAASAKGGAGTIL
jgi:hypothetical protein